MKRLAPIVVTALGSAFAVAAAQQQQPPAPQQPTFRGTSVLVTVDAYPQRDGRIVPGLSASDFEVLEDNKPQTIEEVEFVRVEPAPLESARRDPNTEAEARALAADPRNRVFIAYLDGPHTTIQGSHAIRQPLIDTLNRVMGPTDLFGVMSPNLEARHLVLGRRLLGIEEQLSRNWPWGQRERLTRDRENPIEEALYNCFNAYPTAQGSAEWIVEDEGGKRYLYEVLIDRNREDRTLTSLEKLVDHLAGLREARTVVLLVSDGWLLYQSNQGLANEAGRWPAPAPGIVIGGGGQMGLARGTEGGTDRARCNSELVRLAGLDHQRRFRDLINRANRHNVTFYPVAPGGLTTFDVSPATAPAPRNTAAMPLARNMERRTWRLDALQTVAANTDGIAIVNTNDLSAGLRRVVDDVSAYYLVRYYSTNTQNDGGYRRISLKVRQPGIQVRARRGYLAPSSKPGAAVPASAPKPSTAIDVTEALASLSRIASSPELFTRGVLDGSELLIAVEMPSGQVSAPAWRNGADVAVTVADGAGRQVGTGSGRIDPATRGVLVRVSPAELGTGPWRVMSRVTAGDAMLQDRTEIRAAPPELLGPPLFYRGTPAASSPLRPVADYQYRRTERVRVEWRIPEPLDSRSARLLSRNGQPLAVPVTLTEQTRDGRAVLAADVNLAPLSAGDYVIEVVAGRASRSFRTLVAIRIVP